MSVPCSDAYILFTLSRWLKQLVVTVLADQGGQGLAGLGSESAILDVSKGSSALCQAATPRAYQGAASEETSNKYVPILLCHGGSRA